MMNWCVPPIKWLQRWIVPQESDDWARVPFQPMLYFCLWFAAIVMLIWGDFAAHPEPFSDLMTTGTFWAWGGLSLLCPPLALGSLRMIRDDAPGHWKYRGLWLRLGADIGQFVALMMYTIVRFQIGDYHVYPVACLVACGLFVFHLILRDAKRLREVEVLASQIHRGII